MFRHLRSLVYRLLGISCPHCNGYGERFVVDSWDCDTCDGKGFTIEKKGIRE